MAVQTSEIETGYGDVNARIEWVKYTVQSLNHSNCYACASGRPTAQTVPFPLGWTRDSQGMRCMIALYQEKAAWGNEACKSLALLFPSLRDSSIRVPPAFSAAIGNHTACLSRQARNQIASGFESLFWWVTINKSIYYNQQIFINYTRDAIREIAEQLDATSRMAWENRIALDMMIVEKGGVCVCVCVLFLQLHRLEGRNVALR